MADNPLNLEISEGAKIAVAPKWPTRMHEKNGSARVAPVIHQDTRADLWHSVGSGNEDRGKRLT